MTDKFKYPRFGGDRKLAEGTLAGCQCCNNDTRATHEVTVNLCSLMDKFVNVCPHHVGQARRYHTFAKFLAAAGG